MSTVLVFFISLCVLNAQDPDEECKFVKLTSPGEEYPIDVCRTYVTNGNAEYRKYICDGNYDDGFIIRDQVYDGDDCTGDLSRTENMTYVVADCYNNGTSCPYIMAQTPCTGDNYTIQPYIIKNCIDPGNIPFDSYMWNCTSTTVERIRYDLKR